MTAASYHRLLLYHRACGTAAHDADSNDKWFPAPYERYSSSCGKCRRDSNKGGIDEYRTACKAMFLRRPSPSTILDVGVPEKVAATWFERRSGMPCLHRPQYFQEFRSAYAVERVISKVSILLARLDPTGCPQRYLMSFAHLGFICYRASTLSSATMHPSRCSGLVLPRFGRFHVVPLHKWKVEITGPLWSKLQGLRTIHAVSNDRLHRDDAVQPHLPLPL